MLDFGAYVFDDLGPSIGIFGLFLYALVLAYFAFPILVVATIASATSDRWQSHHSSPVDKPTVNQIPQAPTQADSRPKSWDQIADMSHLPYDEYLKSDAWNERRGLLLERFSHKCQVCGSSTRLHIHHRTYERLGNERMEDLTVLCEACHQAFHAYRGMPKSGKPD